MINILINALRSETDSLNAQHLLTGLLTSVEDLAAYTRNNYEPEDNQPRSNHGSFSGSEDLESHLGKEGIPGILFLIF
jgi:hypothetical protein